jgi:hypothetical protein
MNVGEKCEIPTSSINVVLHLFIYVCLDSIYSKNTKYQIYIWHQLLSKKDGEVREEVD